MGLSANRHDTGLCKMLHARENEQSAKHGIFEIGPLGFFPPKVTVDSEALLFLLPPVSLHYIRKNIFFKKEVLRELFYKC